MEKLIRNPQLLAWKSTDLMAEYGEVLAWGSGHRNTNIVTFAEDGEFVAWGSGHRNTNIVTFAIGVGRDFYNPVFADTEEAELLTSDTDLTYSDDLTQKPVRRQTAAQQKN